MPSFDTNPADHATAVAVLLHPHPDFGGNRHNVVIEALYRALPSAGVTAVRFDFSSSDVAVASAEAVEALGVSDTRPLVLVGYSFGGDIAAGITDPRLAGWLLIAPPLRMVPAAAMGAGPDTRPTRILVPEHDQFSPPARTAQETAGWLDTTLAVIPGGDHFLSDATPTVVELALDWVGAIVSAEA